MKTLESALEPLLQLLVRGDGGALAVQLIIIIIIMILSKCTTVCNQPKFHQNSFEKLFTLFTIAECRSHSVFQTGSDGRLWRHWRQR